MTTVASPWFDISGSKTAAESEKKKIRDELETSSPKVQVHLELWVRVM